MLELPRGPARSLLAPCGLLPSLLAAACADVPRCRGGHATPFTTQGTELWDTKGKALYQACMEETRALVLASGCGRPALTFEDWLRLHEYPTKARRAGPEQQARRREPGRAQAADSGRPDCGWW